MFIKALAKRYGPEALEDRSKLDQAYTVAMRDYVQTVSKGC